VVNAAGVGTYRMQRKDAAFSECVEKVTCPVIYRHGCRFILNNFVARTHNPATIVGRVQCVFLFRSLWSLHCCLIAAGRFMKTKRQIAAAISITFWTSTG